MEMEERILRFLKSEKVEPFTLEMLEHKHLMRARKQFSLRIESNASLRPDASCKSANVISTEIGSGDFERAA